MSGGWSLGGSLGFSVGGHLKTIKHSVTRFRITLDCYEAEYVADLDGKPAGTDVKWLPPAALDDYPLNSSGRKLAKFAQ